MQEPDLLAYLSHCLLIPKSNSLHRLYHQFLLFFTVGLCFTISFSPLILACLGEANHPKKFLGESPDAAIKYIKRCLFAQLIKGVETVPSYKEQECYYLIMDSCFTLLQKSVLLNIWVMAIFSWWFYRCLWKTPKQQLNKWYLPSFFFHKSCYSVCIGAFLITATVHKVGISSCIFSL